MPHLHRLKAFLLYINVILSKKITNNWTQITAIISIRSGQLLYDFGTVLFNMFEQSTRKKIEMHRNRNSNQCLNYVLKYRHNNLFETFSKIIYFMYLL